MKHSFFRMTGTNRPVTARVWARLSGFQMMLWFQSAHSCRDPVNVLWFYLEGPEEKLRVIFRLNPERGNN